MEIRSTLAMNTLLANRLTTSQAQLQKLQDQVASGQKASTFAELGTQAGICIALHNEAGSIEAYQQSNEMILSRIAAMDQAMTAIHDVAESVKSDAYAVMSSDDQRTALRNSARGGLDSVINALQVSVSGRALFSGDQTDVIPLVSNLLTTLQANIAALPTPADATSVETAIQNFFATASNYFQGGGAINPTPVDKNISIDYGILASNSAFKDVLQGLVTIALTPAPDGIDTTEAEYATIIQNAAASLSSGVGQLNQLISFNGSNQSLLQTINDQHATTLTMVKTQINTIEETDMTEAAAQLSQLRTQIEATYAMTSQLNQLSLVKYLK